MRRNLGPLPLWGWLLAGGLVVGVVVYRKRQAAAAAASAAAAPQGQTGTDSGSVGGTDPMLDAYTSGEASGVSIYSEGVQTGIQLVDSISGMFPGGLESNASAAQPVTVTVKDDDSDDVTTPKPAAPKPPSPKPVAKKAAPTKPAPRPIPVTLPPPMRKLPTPRPA